MVYRIRDKSNCVLLRTTHVDFSKSMSRKIKKKGGFGRRDNNQMQIHETRLVLDLKKTTMNGVLEKFT